MATGVVRLFQSVRRFGWKGVAKRIAYLGCTHSWMLGIADVQVLGLTVYDPTAGGRESLSDYVFQLASPADLNAILLCSPLAERDKLRTLFQGFFARGFRCAIARHNDTVVGYNWAFTGSYTITLDDYRHHTARVDLPPGTAFTGNAYVQPEHRGRGVIRKLKQLLFSRYPAGTRFYTAISELNRSSLRANTQVGFEKLATLRFTRTPFGNRVYLRAPDDCRWHYIGHTTTAIQIDGREVRPGRLEPVAGAMDVKR